MTVWVGSKKKNHISTCFFIYPQVYVEAESYHVEAESQEVKVKGSEQTSDQNWLMAAQGNESPWAGRKGVSEEMQQSFKCSCCSLTWNNSRGRKQTLILTTEQKSLAQEQRGWWWGTSNLNILVSNPQPLQFSASVTIRFATWLPLLFCIF